ncbi:MAG: histidine--tRNA ligase [Candidatus Lokiarchaeota archaeon]|nr:histidine--tRNA ligase [Candidatus Lokiarchaeota archaeon]MBD3202309.1 histidine--tRNA ligase [Candidatus Lokiarchaeota archaeon]
MSEKFPTRPIRGMNDLYPRKLRIVNYLIETIKKVADLYCYEEFESPLLEPIEIFAAKSSEELVNEQSFVVEKKKNERLILRPELTPSLARMVAKKSQALKKPIRWFSVPTCYRYERPQRGRSREFKQPNFDILAENSIYADLEIINIAIDILTTLGANEDQFQIFFNNRRFIDSVCELILGIDKKKMPLVYKILDKFQKMDSNEFDKYVLDSFDDEFIIQGIYKLTEANDIEELMSSFENIPPEFFEAKGFNELKQLELLLDESGLSKYCTFSSGIVRGLDYYTGTVFEVFDTGEENRRSIFGGGRYDNLLDLFSEEKLSGVGFGMGILTLRLFLQTYDLIPDNLKEKDYSKTIYIATLKEEVAPYTVQIANKIRNDGYACIIDYRFESIGNQLSKANELGVKISLIIGPNEMNERSITIKNMKTEKQKSIKFENLNKEITALFS